MIKLINENVTDDYGNELKQFIGYAIEGVVEYLERNGFQITKKVRSKETDKNVFGTVLNARSEYIDMYNEVDDIRVRLFISGNGRTFNDFVIIGSRGYVMNLEDVSRSDAQYFHEDYNISGVPVKRYGGNKYYPYQISNRIISQVNTLLNYVDKIQNNQEHATDETRDQMKKLVDSCTEAVRDAIAVLGTFN